MRAVSASAQCRGWSLLPIGVHSPSLPPGERTPCRGAICCDGQGQAADPKGLDANLSLTSRG